MVNCYRILIKAGQEVSPSILLSALYLPHANILTGAPYSLADVIGSTSRLVDSDENTPATYNFQKANMQLVWTRWTRNGQFTNGRCL